ncbi:NADH-quinone oxidoreductase subunit J [Haliscomenobacter hydrossis]|uniref:NADH-quinone oxidoreductase subunit J n=1 Tax=Haliscomenobacter hydrossis (strain ATCC 27775 / DSM 1100 / LMG 10767 / O) TaxID=760192 RepID=F4KW39_HALH1|nr:NADH-quinone oxidoreductase subunit J [Haliscomenobacter hydrossis]AEE48237.1 NADH-ubiquinone/plastoquinone oxidoreductase chain 6 [Haliscomenobacter hydrossis DSM 1100]
MDQVIFYILSTIAIIGALSTVVSRNAMYSVLSLVVTFFALAGIYLQLNAEFVAIVHIIVYAGAIMVLFLFVVMMLNLNTVTVTIRKNPLIKYLAVLVGIIMAALLGFASMNTALPIARGNTSAEVGTVKVLGKMLFNEYLLPFELISVLLIATMVGVIVLTKKEE